MSDRPDLAAPAPPAPATAAPAADARTRATLLFVRMWALAHVIHLVSATGSALDTPFNLAVVVAAFALLLRPASGRWLLLMLVAQLVDMVVEMPFSPDHWMLMSFANLAILVTLAVRRSTGTAALEAAFPALRVVVLVAYASAALAKWNWNFLDPVMSCAGAIAGAASLGATDGLGLGPVFVVVVLACETSIPVLLAVPRTRRHGVRLALAFHFTLSMSPAFAVVDFTSTLYALFLLFLPYDDVAGVLDRVQRWAGRSAVVRDARRAPLVTAVVAFLGVGLLGWVAPRGAAALVLVGAEIYLLGVLASVLLGWRASRGTRPFGRLLRVQVPVVLLTVLWAAGPYLGMRTTGVFTMFSGLRTEGTAPNHVFLPSTHLTPWQDDFVVIESSNAPALETADGGRLGLPLVELRRMAMDDPDLVVTGRLHGEDVTFGPGDGQRALAPLPWWQHKFLHFRPVVTGDTPFCSVS
jgi:hypothetical protein